MKSVQRMNDPLGREIPAHLKPKKTNSKFPFSFQKYEEESAKSLFSKIEENYKIASWSKANFEYSVIKTEFLHSILLKGNELFEELISFIEEFNNEVRTFLSNGKAIRNGPWRQTFYLRLQSLLLETIYTREQDIQQKFLEKVYDWVLDQLARNDNDDVYSVTRPITAVTSEQHSKVTRPFSSITKSSSSQNKVALKNDLPSISHGRPMSSLPYKDKRPISATRRPFSGGVRSIRPISAIARTELEAQPIEEEPVATHEEEHEIEKEQIKTMAPSKLREEMLKDYAAGHRTAHEGVNAPYERLKLYSRKQLIPKENQNFIREPETPKLFSTPELQVAGDLKEDKGDEEDEEIDENADIEETVQETTQKEIKTKATKEPKKKGKGKKKKKKKINPIFLKGISFQPTLKAFEKEADLEHHPVMDHFDPLSDYISYVPTKFTREKQFEARILKEKQKELKQKREDEEYCEHMNKWAKAKSQFETESTRKYSLKLYGSKFEKTAFQKAQPQISLNEEKAINQEEVEFEEDDGEDVDPAIDEPVSKIPAKNVEPKDLVEESEQRALTALGNKKHGVTDLEQKEKQLMIDSSRRIYSGVLPKPNSHDTENIVRPPSLSVYSKPVSNVRPFSAINLSATRMTSTNKEAAEIMEIKDRLEGKNIGVNIRTLTNALLVPMGFKNPEKFELPRPGSALMFNPFSKLNVTKKKKKGKKKKAKK